MSDAVVVSKTEFYKVKPKTPVRLSVVIGDAQIGGTAVTWKGATVGSGAKIDDLQIGKPGEDVSGTDLDCTTTVKDVNPNGNHTSVTYQLRGGVADRVFTYEVTVTDSGRAVYLVTFMLS